MNDEENALAYGVGQGVRTELDRVYGPDGGQRITDAICNSGVLTAEHLLRAAQAGMSPQQIAEGLAQAAFRGSVDMNPEHWGRTGIALDDEEWHRIRAKQKVESVGRPWSTK